MRGYNNGSMLVCITQQRKSYADESENLKNYTLLNRKKIKLVVIMTYVYPFGNIHHARNDFS